MTATDPSTRPIDYTGRRVRFHSVQDSLSAFDSAPTAPIPVVSASGLPMANGSRAPHPSRPPHASHAAPSNRPFAYGRLGNPPLADVPLAELTVIGAFSGILASDLTVDVPVKEWPDSVKERPRDHLYRWLTLLMARLFLPFALVASGGKGVRRTASEWALTLRFPSGKLAGLTEETRTALVTARTEAFWRHGELISVTSGRRSVAAQQRMFDAAVERYGSVSEARRWVLPPVESAHVRGTAMDIRPFGGARWLDRCGEEYGLYRTFDNEWWHFEYLGETATARQWPAS